ncbi:hypothetical protein ABIQ69_15640 [Agromyces sp. G08B096]|uniref:Multidrug transporter n=1 Tax=Agromyces sp. G08B096 TaxID=3156399 RepID=A0AAU7W9B4_9MICO
MARDENASGPNPAQGRDDGALTDDELIRKDVSESPGSEAETAAKQTDPIPDAVAEDIDTDRVRAVPGTGGPDDAGDVDVSADEIHLPGRDR